MFVKGQMVGIRQYFRVAKIQGASKGLEQIHEVISWEPLVTY
jgi:hypothetical protein